MAQAKAVESLEIDAPPEIIYNIFADYKNKHPKILPDEHFSDYSVETEGMGSGTIVQFKSHILGQTRDVRVEVSEPEPGRVLSETELNSDLVTKFIVEPVNNEQTALVTITTEYTKPGISGLFESLMAPFLLQRIYKKELEKVAEYVHL